MQTDRGNAMGIIKTDKLTFEYIRRDEEGNVEGITRAVDEVDMDIRQGDFIAILGHNGSGSLRLPSISTRFSIRRKGQSGWTG